MSPSISFAQPEPQAQPAAFKPSIDRSASATSIGAATSDSGSAIHPTTAVHHSLIRPTSPPPPARHRRHSSSQSLFDPNPGRIICATDAVSSAVVSLQLNLQLYHHHSHHHPSSNSSSERRTVQTLSSSSRATPNTTDSTTSPSTSSSSSSSPTHSPSLTIQSPLHELELDPQAHHTPLSPQLILSLLMAPAVSNPKPKIMTTPSGKPIPPRPRKLALLGSRSVGKSSLAVQFVDEHFVESYYPTIEHTFQKTVELKGQLFNLELFDTAGHDEFTILDSKQAIGLDGWALIYSINSRSSFDMVSIIRDKILNFTGQESVPMVLIGNKCDLESQRQISFEEGAALAKQFGCAFTEASARSGEHVAESFLLGLAEVEKEINPDSARAEGSKCLIS